MKRNCHIREYTTIQFSNGTDFILPGTTVSRNDTLLSTYHYLADGTKYKVMDPDNNGRVYIGPFFYTTAKAGNTVYSYLEGIDTDGGRIMIVRKQSGTQNTYDYTTAFFVKDHLGSTRVMLNAQGDILERNAYYPFGLQMNQGKAYPTLTERLPQLYAGYISSTPARRDIYNGKELQTAAGTDYLDYGFRQYDQTIARWFNIDPKAEKYLPITPYNYCAVNPVLLLDYHGDTLSYINASPKDIQSIINIYNQGLGGYYTVGIDKKNHLQLTKTEGWDDSQMTKEERTVYTILKRIIDGSNTEIKVERNSNVIIGRAKDATIDIGDIENLEGYKYTSSLLGLLHESYEQFLIQKSPSKSKDENRVKLAHFQARGVERIFLNLDYFHDFRERKTDWGVVIALELIERIGKEEIAKDYEIPIINNNVKKIVK